MLLVNVILIFMLFGAVEYSRNKKQGITIFVATIVALLIGAVIFFIMGSSDPITTIVTWYSSVADSFTEKGGLFL